MPKCYKMSKKPIQNLAAAISAEKLALITDAQTCMYVCTSSTCSEARREQLPSNGIASADIARATIFLFCFSRPFLPSTFVDCSSSSSATIRLSVVSGEFDRFDESCWTRQMVAEEGDRGTRYRCMSVRKKTWRAETFFVLVRSETATHQQRVLSDACGEPDMDAWFFLLINPGKSRARWPAIAVLAFSFFRMINATSPLRS